MSNDSGKLSLSTAALRLVANTATHPLELTKILIQIGHEPIAPRPTLTFLKSPALALPNAFQYLRYIKKTDGLLGWYRGLGIKLVSQSVSMYTYHCTSEVLKANEIFQVQRGPHKPVVTAKEDAPEDSEEDEEACEEESLYDEEASMNERSRRLASLVAARITCRTVSIIISQPFHVATMRAMAQFVGREKTYSGVLGAITGVYKESGLVGYWSGLVPRIIGEAATITLSALSIFVVRTYVVQDASLANIISAIMTFLASSITYPFHVVANCMAVKGSMLKAAQPPNMPPFISWIGCWQILSAESQLMRGSSLLWRYYNGPQIVIGGRAVPIEPFKRI